MKGSEPPWNVTGPNHTRPERAPITAGFAEWSSPTSILFRPMRDTNRRSFPAGSTRLRLSTAGTWRSRSKASSLRLSPVVSDHGNCTVQPKLLPDSFDEILDLHGRQSRFCVQKVIQPGALVVIAEPCFASAGNQKRYDDRRKEGAKVLLEQ